MESCLRSKKNLRQGYGYLGFRVGVLLGETRGEAESRREKRQDEQGCGLRKLSLVPFHRGLWSRSYSMEWSPPGAKRLNVDSSRSLVTEPGRVGLLESGHWEHHPLVSWCICKMGPRCHLAELPGCYGKSKETIRAKSTVCAEKRKTCFRTRDGPQARVVGKVAWNPFLKFRLAQSTLASRVLRIQCLRGEKEKKEKSAFFPLHQPTFGNCSGIIRTPAYTSHFRKFLI